MTQNVLAAVIATLAAMIPAVAQQPAPEQRPLQRLRAAIIVSDNEALENAIGLVAKEVADYFTYRQ